MKTKHFLLLASCLMPTLGHAYYETTSCNEYSVPVFNNVDGCKNPVTKCFTHPGYTSAKVTGCASTDCYSGYTWEEFMIGYNIGSSLGKCSNGDSSSGLPECYVNSGGSYKCAAGCWGAASYTGNSVTGCKKCPENSTCANACQGCSFTCNDEYYRSGDYCLPCPDHAKCTNNEISCKVGYYRSAGGTYCIQCPKSSDISPASGNQTASGTSLAGTKDITGCYLNAGYPFVDGTGSYSFSSHCYYSK